MKADSSELCLGISGLHTPPFILKLPFVEHLGPVLRTAHSSLVLYRTN
jgi:hypothetical protein